MRTFRQRMARPSQSCRSRSATHCCSIRCARCWLGEDPRRLALTQRDLYCAAHALGCKHEIDCTAEFMRDEIAYEACAVTGLVRCRNRWTTDFTPYEDQVRCI